MSYYICLYFFFFNDTATTEIYTLSLHDALPICFLEHLGDGREAVGGAGSVGNDVVLCRIVGLVVHAEDESRIGAIGGGGGDDFFYGRAGMLLGIGAFGEGAGRFDNDIGAGGGPN